MPRTVTVIYHQEPEGWWAESPDAPSFFATGVDRDTMLAHVREHLPRVVGDDIEEFREVEIASAVSVAAADDSKGGRFVPPGMPLIVAPMGGTV